MHVAHFDSNLTCTSLSTFSVFCDLIYHHDLAQICCGCAESGFVMGEAASGWTGGFGWGLFDTTPAGGGGSADGAQGNCAPVGVHILELAHAREKNLSK